MYAPWGALQWFQSRYLQRNSGFRYARVCLLVNVLFSRCAVCACVCLCVWVFVCVCVCEIVYKSPLKRGNLGSHSFMKEKQNGDRCCVPLFIGVLLCVYVCFYACLDFNCLIASKLFIWILVLDVSWVRIFEFPFFCVKCASLVIFTISFILFFSDGGPPIVAPACVGTGFGVLIGSTTCDNSDSVTTSPCPSYLTGPTVGFDKTPFKRRVRACVGIRFGVLIS